MSDSDPFKAYLRDLQKDFSSGLATEETHRPALKTLLETIGQKVRVTNEPKRVECGAPDFIVSRATGHGPLTLGYVETKDLGESLDVTERSEQLKRYRHSLDNLVLTDYLEFRWYVGGDLRETARLARIGKGNKLDHQKGGEEAVFELLSDFLAHKPERISTPKELAERMARLTHLIRDIVVEAFDKDKASYLLNDLRKAFADTLIPDLDKPEKTAEFADMYAQTIAYGLFAARCNHGGPGPFRRLGAAAEIPKTNPFLRKLFEAITGTALDDEPYSASWTTSCSFWTTSTWKRSSPHFGRRSRRETRSSTSTRRSWRPTTRSSARPAASTTPPSRSSPTSSAPWTIYSVSASAGPGGLSDTATVGYERQQDGESPEVDEATAPRVLILDPACGTGTFLYSVVDQIREQFMKQGNLGMWSGYVHEHLLPRLFGFELLMAPYAVARLQARHAARGPGLVGRRNGRTGPTLRFKVSGSGSISPTHWRRPPSDRSRRLCAIHQR